MIRDDEDRMTHGYRRALGPTPGRKAPILRSQRAVFAMARRVRRLHQGRTQPTAAFARLAAPPLPPTLVVPRTDPRPRRDLARRAPALHLQADLRQELLRGALAH